MRSLLACPVVGRAARSGRRRTLAAGTLLGALAVAASFLTSASAYASSNYIVDGTNSSCSDNGSGAGSAAQPFCTIAAAAKKAQAGDTVSVIAGTYTGTGVNPTNTGVAGSPVTFAASPGVTISGGTKAFALSSKNYIVISGFTITGTSSYGISVSNGSNDTISGNTITGTGSHAIYLSGGSNNTVSGNTESYAGTPQQGLSAYGIWLNNETGDLVKGNVTHDNSAHGIYLSGTTTGALVKGNTSYHNAYQWERNANGINDIAPGNSLIGNVTYANEDSGINIYPGGDSALVAENVTYGNGDHGIDDLNVTGGRIIGNTVYGNCSDGINVEGTSSNYLIENNISDNNATGAEVKPTIVNYSPYKTCAQRRNGNIGVYDTTAPGTTTADYNLVYQSGSAPDFIWGTATYTSWQAICNATGQDCHAIVADPQFVSAGAANFQLTAGSPAIDKANTAASGEQPADILGVSPYDDLGAYEYAGGGGTQTGPTAQLSVTPSSGTAPLAVTADASASTAGSSPISSYTFDFGDGTTVGPQPGPTASHTFTAAGSYVVKVTATDGNGLTSQANQTVTVNPQATGPTAQLSVTPSSGTAPLAVTADASASTAGSSPISSYTFDFGDGTTVGPQPGPTASHTFTAAGSYVVKVTATDGNGLTSQANQTVTVNPQATGPTAQLSVTPSSGTAPLAVTADASASTAGSSPISSYTFDFGDGTTVGPQPGPTASHTFTAAGSYVVKVTATDGNGLTSQANQTVTVNPQATGPTAQLSVTPSSGTAPLAVTADASASTAGSSPISSYTFDFGDGTTVGPQPGPTASHTFTAAGSYVVKVTATDGNGLTSQANQTVTVNPQSSSPAKYVNQIATNYSTNSHTSGYVTVYRTAGVAAGDMIIATIQLTGTSAGAASGTDSKGDALSVVSDVSDGNGDRLITVAGIAVNGLAANDTITIRFPTASGYHMTADEVSGVTSVDQQSAASGTGSAFSSGSTGTTARSGEFVYATVATFGGTSLSWNSGWTALSSYTVGSTAIGRAYQIPKATGTFAASGTASGNWLAQVVTFK